MKDEMKKYDGRTGDIRRLKRYWDSNNQHWETSDRLHTSTTEERVYTQPIVTTTLDIGRTMSPICENICHRVN